MLDKFNTLWQAQPAHNSTAGSSAGFGELRALAYLGPGRPLGHHFDAQGDLIICNSLQGLVKWNADSQQVTLLTSRVSSTSPLAPSTLINYANDLTIAADGTIYFTDSSAIHVKRHEQGYWDTYNSYFLTMLQGSPTGRLLAFSPQTGETNVLAQGLWYSNGVALSQDGGSLVVAETCSMTLHRHWLRGPKAGKTEVLLRGLPGFPDGVSLASDGNFWVSMPSPTVPVVKLLSSRWLRFVIGYLPDRLKPKPAKVGLLLKVTSDGKPIALYSDTSGRHISSISAVTESNGVLVFGSLMNSYISVLSLGDLEATVSPETQRQSL
eukprot:jgi/Astpho2/3773/e_gw1.00060.44.1_t